MAYSLLITGTDTGVGKTTVAAGLAAALQQRAIDVAVIKPIETGCAADQHGALIPADAMRLRWAAGREAVPLDVVSPFRFRAPLAPSVAAAREGRCIELAAITAAVRRVMAGAELTLVEGAGGLAVPLTPEGQTFADLARACDLRMLLVVGNRLGAINHARLTVAWARAHGLEVAGYVVNMLTNAADLAAETNVGVLGDLLGPALGIFPYTAVADETPEARARLARAAEQHLDLDALMR